MQRDVADPEIPTFSAYGEPDDHLRLTVLLAGALERFEPGAAAVCRTAEKNPWSQRFDALRELIRAAVLRRPASQQPVAVVRDIAALPSRRPRSRERWDDQRFVFERSLLHDVLVQAQEEALLRLDEEPRVVAGAATTVDAFGPSLRPVARWLCEQGLVDEHTLRAYLRLDRPELVLAAAWDALRPSTREAAVRLAVLRPAHALNGVLGPFPIGPDIRATASDDGPAPIRRDQLDELLAAGFVQRTAESARRARVPRAVREFLRAHETTTPADVRRANHRDVALALRADAERDAPSSMEQHHHAVMALDESLAVQTARFYGADLRTLGTEASLAGRYDDAARIFRSVVERFDPRDAYAWEYLGYNLWWPHRRAPQQMPEAVAAEALTALERACTLDERNGRNPLYLGRLLAFRGSRGGDIRPEFDRWMEHFTRRFYSGPERLSWFIEPIEKAFGRANRSAEFTTLCEPWAEHLQRMRAGQVPSSDSAE